MFDIGDVPGGDVPRVRPLLADVSVVFDADVLKLPLIGATNLFDDEFVFRQVVEGFST